MKLNQVNLFYYIEKKLSQGFKKLKYPKSALVNKLEIIIFILNKIKNILSYPE